MGVVAGAVVGVSLGVLLLILIVWLVFRKKEKKRYEEDETPNEIRQVCKLYGLYNIINLRFPLIKNSLDSKIRSFIVAAHRKEFSFPVP